MEHKLKVLTILDQLIPSNIIGVIKPMMELQRMGEIKFSMQYTFSYKEKDIVNCDVVVLCRNLRSVDLKILELVKKHNKKLIYDIDDNFFDISIDSPIGKYHRHPIHLYVVSKMIENADAVRVYSRPMESIAKHLNENTYRLKGYFDFGLINNLQKTKSDKIKIVYATSRGMDDTLTPIFMPAVVRILEEYGEKIEFCVFGSIPFQLQKFKNVRAMPYQANYNKFIDFFYKQGFNIGMAPLLDDIFHKSKTNNKFREYGAMSVSGIYSRSEIYKDCVINGENGLLIENTTENWYKSLKELIDNSELRTTIAKNAYETVKYHYSFECTIEDWRKILNAKEYLKKFNNILSLKPLIVFENIDDMASQIRWNPLNHLLSSVEIPYRVIDINEITPIFCKDYDVVICFLMHSSKSEIINDIEKYTSNIIVDCLEDINPKKENIIYTNPDYTNTAQTYQIINQEYCEFNNLLDLLYSNKLINDKQEDVTDLAQTVQSRKNDLEEEFFSINSAIFQWATLLERFKGTNEPIQYNIIFSKFIKLYQKLVSPFARIKYKLKKITNRLGTFRTKRKLVRRMIIDYININIRKNY